MTDQNQSGGMGCRTRELQWTDTGSLERTDQEDDKRVLRKQIECMELCLGMEMSLAESLSVRVEERMWL